MTDICKINSNISKQDTKIIRDIAKKVLALSEHPKNLERKQAWLNLDSGDQSRVMVLAEYSQIRDVKKPIDTSVCLCKDDWAKEVELYLRGLIYRFEVLGDDHVIEPKINVRWNIQCSSYGVDIIVHQGGDETTMGSKIWVPPVIDLDRDLKKLKHRSFNVNRKAAILQKQRLEDILGDILEVRFRDSHFWTMGMTSTAIQLHGLENLMLSMYDNPDGVHAIMQFLHDDHIAFLEWLQMEQLITLDNENDYIGSGSMGYTKDLPSKEFCASGIPFLRDRWGLLESQETVGVSPAQFEEFIFPYQLSIAEKFGKIYYGCCEPIHTRFNIIKRIPNLARVSVSPWADQSMMAEFCGKDYVFSRKPNPTLISTSSFDEDLIRQDINDTLKTAAGCRVEIIMKDVHTLNNEPDRLGRWVQIARRQIESFV